METNQQSQFIAIMKGNGVIQPSVLIKSSILYVAFNEDANLFNLFIEQVKQSYTYKKLSSNPASQDAYLTTVLFNEIRSIEEYIAVS